MALGKDKWSNKPGTGKSSLLAIRTRGNPVIVEKVKRRPVSQTPAASTKGATGQHADHDLPGQGPLADTTATVTLGSESAVDNSREAGAEVAVRQLADHGLSDDAPKPAPQNTAGEDAAVSPDVGVPVVDGGTERAGGNFSLGKNQFYLHDGEVSSVSTYASAINDHWQRGVDAFMNIARVCADANARLTTAQKRELIQALPFGDTAFSKFVQIGIDTRLYAPDMQRRLPPYYTTTYAVTLLTDEELKQAIAENVIYPDMKRKSWRDGAASRKNQAKRLAVLSRRRTLRVSRRLRLLKTMILRFQLSLSLPRNRNHSRPKRLLVRQTRSRGSLVRQLHCRATPEF